MGRPDTVTGPTRGRVKDLTSPDTLVSLQSVSLVCEGSDVATLVCEASDALTLHLPPPRHVPRVTSLCPKTRTLPSRTGRMSILCPEDEQGSRTTE